MEAGDTYNFQGWVVGQQGKNKIRDNNAEYPKPDHGGAVAYSYYGGYPGQSAPPKQAHVTDKESLPPASDAAARGAAATGGHGQHDAVKSLDEAHVMNKGLPTSCVATAGAAANNGGHSQHDMVNKQHASHDHMVGAGHGSYGGYHGPGYPAGQHYGGYHGPGYPSQFPPPNQGGYWMNHTYSGAQHMNVIRPPVYYGHQLGYPYNNGGAHMMNMGYPASGAAAYSYHGQHYAF